MWRIEGERLESCIKRREAVFQRERIPQSIDRTTIKLFHKRSLCF